MSLVYCRRCGAPVVAGKPVCPVCRTRDPTGQRAAVVGVLIIATLTAAAITGGYAFAISHEWVWERWQRRFDALPDDHALRGHAWDVAFVLGVAVFVVAWVLAVAGLGRVVKTR
jgi:hypothetical protein